MGVFSQVITLAAFSFFFPTPRLHPALFVFTRCNLSYSALIMDLTGSSNQMFSAASGTGCKLSPCLHFHLRWSPPGPGNCSAGGPSSAALIPSCTYVLHLPATTPCPPPTQLHTLPIHHHHPPPGSDPSAQPPRKLQKLQAQARRAHRYAANLVFKYLRFLVPSLDRNTLFAKQR